MEKEQVQDLQTLINRNSVEQPYLHQNEEERKTDKAGNESARSHNSSQNLSRKQQQQHFSRQASNNNSNKQNKKWKLYKFRRNQNKDCNTAAATAGGAGLGVAFTAATGKKRDQPQQGVTSKKRKNSSSGDATVKVLNTATGPSVTTVTPGGAVTFGDENQSSGGTVNPEQPHPGQHQQHQQQQGVGKNKHLNKNVNNLMQVRTKRLQAMSKFFLPDKRPRKECIIPPTKFLLGGNISDPLNLNSLQNESENAVTPKSSPIATPPHHHHHQHHHQHHYSGGGGGGGGGSGGGSKQQHKIEVIIPPNINDPLHLLDPVDSVEYEMQLCSPMKKKQRARNKRKRKSKQMQAAAAAAAAAADAEATTAEEAQLLDSQAAAAVTGSTAGTPMISDTMGSPTTAVAESSTKTKTLMGSSEHHLPTPAVISMNTFERAFAAEAATAAAAAAAASAASVVATTTSNLTGGDVQDYMGNRTLRLNLETGRKRRISESTSSINGSVNNSKVRRMDSMDKIVSPVIPQPGGWKRAHHHWPIAPPQQGARNRTRTQSCTSNSEDQGTTQESDQPARVVSSASIKDNQAAKEGPESKDKDSGGSDKVTSAASKASRSTTDAKYHYGNYDRYFGYRNLNEFIDVRLKVFLRNPYLFRDKDVLDVGCNVGLMTIAVAKMLHTKSVTGIDIDASLIAKARRNLKSHVRIPHHQQRKQQEKQHKPVTANNVTATVSVLKEEKVEHAVIHSDEPAQRKPMREMEESTTVACEVVEVRDQQREQNQQPQPEQEEGAAAAVGEENNPQQMTGSAAEPSRFTPKVRPHQQHSHRGGRGCRGRGQRGFRGRKPHYTHHSHQKSGRKGSSHQQRRHNATQHQNQLEYFPISCPLSLGNMGTLRCRVDVANGKPASKHFPNNVIFKTMNYVLKDESLINYDTQQYDLILCLSVTKWIHLNFGDNGLKIAFKRIFNHLRPGGKLILEAQNWASYKKKKKLTETIFENYKNIEFFPNRFHDFLLSPEVGFSHSYPLGIPRHLSKGFRRPIQLYIKGDFTPSQAQWSDTYHPQTPHVNHHNIYTDIVTTTPTQQNHCIWGSTTPYQPSYSTRCTPSHSFMATSPYYNPRQTDSYQPSYDAGNRRGSYCFASPLYSTTWSPPSDLLSHRRSASNTPNSASIRSTENDDHYGLNTSNHRQHVYPPMEVFPLEASGSLAGGSLIAGSRSYASGSASVRQTDSDSEPSSTSASQTPTRTQYDLDQSSNSPSTTNSQPDK